MERMTKAQENQLTGYVKDVIADVYKGENPTDALYKVASANTLNPQFIRRVGEAYNQSRTLFEMGEKRGSDRLQTFSLANPDTVISKMYPDTYATKTAELKHKQAYASYKIQNSTNYFDMVKAASVKTEFYKEAGIMDKLDPGGKDRNKRLADWASKQEDEGKMKFPKGKGPKDWIAKTHHEKEEVKAAAANAQVKLSSIIRGFQDDFRQKLGSTPFHEIEMGIHQKYGPVTQALVKLAFELSGVSKFGHRRANPAELDASRHTLIDFRAPAFASMENLIGAAMDMHKRSADAKMVCGDPCSEDQNKLQKSVKVETPPRYVTTDELKSVTKTDTEQRAETGQTEKKAIAEPLSWITSKAQGKLKEYSTSGENKYRNELDKSIVSLEDPKFRNDMKQVGVQAMLHDLMTNDEVISGYEPEEVSEAFNNIYQIAPEATSSSAVMRDMLRRHLVQGGIESMEAGQAAQLNKNLRETYSHNDRKDRLESMSFDPRVRESGSVTKQTPGKPSEKDSIKHNLGIKF